MIRLWIYRLKKMLETEKEGIRQYDKIIAACEKGYGNQKVIKILKKIRQDEQIHEELAQEALQIAEKYGRLEHNDQKTLI